MLHNTLQFGLLKERIEQFHYHISPIGSISENKAVDVITDLTIGSVTGNAGSLINTINYTSTMVTAIDGIKELTNQNQDKTDKVTYEKKNQNLEKTIHTPTKSYLMPL